MKSILFFCHLKSCNKPIYSDQDYAVAMFEGKQRRFHLVCYYENLIQGWMKGEKHEKKP